MKIFKNTNTKIGLLIGLMMTKSLYSFGQSTNSDTVPYQLIIVLGFIFIVVLLVLMVAIMMLKVLRIMIRDHEIKKAEEAGAPYIEEASIWEKLDRRFLTQSIAIEEEETIELDHDYDGIKELDNHLPPWWKYMFYMSIVFAVGYILVYHVLGTLPLQEQEYNDEIALANAYKASLVTEGGGAIIDENNVTYSTDEAILTNGKKVYVMNCVPCHKAGGEGGIGPNLTDDYWLNNGGSIKDIFVAVKYGFPDKGMISWEPLLSPQQMNDVASYVKSIIGTNPPNAKAPQGELYVEVADSTLVSK